MPSVKWGLDEPLTYWKALDLLDHSNAKAGRPLNWGGLRLFPEGTSEGNDEIGVVKKGCVSLAEIHPQHVKLNVGHWRSNLAFKAMNASSPLPIGKLGQNWFIVRPGQRRPWLMFFDGISITTGHAVLPAYLWDPKEDPDPALSAWPLFEKYINDFEMSIRRGEKLIASAEGCWQCYYLASKKIEGAAVPKGAEPGGVTHLFEHAAKGEVQASLLWRAMVENNLNPFIRWDSVVGTPKQTSDFSTARGLLTGYFRRRLGLLGAFHFRVRLRKRELKGLVSDSSGSKGAPTGVGKCKDGHAVQPGAAVPRV
jgi:hypothetical protein